MLPITTNIYILGSFSTYWDAFINRLGKFMYIYIYIYITFINRLGGVVQ